MGSLEDIDIARGVQPRPIADVAAELEVSDEFVEPWGRGIAKISLDAIPAMPDPGARYVLITASSPTPLGEGKTTTAVGLADGLRHVGKRAVVALRQPSLGPTFGMKGGAAGGGYAQVIPFEQLNLHLTGDFHAVTTAVNLLAALIDNHLHRGNQLGLEEHAITWHRVVDLNDRALRHVIIGLGTAADGVPRQTSFDITAASEVMSILALASDLRDLRNRLGRIVVGYNRHRSPVTAEDLAGAGAMTVLMKEALQPNLLQTLEGTPALIHAGPFANIAHGASSIVADQLGMRGAEYVVTEAGFGADIGAEKFFNIKCRASGLAPDAAVIVTTVRALKMHSGNYHVRAGRPLPQSILVEQPDDVIAGAANLRHHIAVVRRHGVVPVVAINSIAGDHESERDAIAAVCKEEGVRWAVVDAYANGGAGAADLAREVEAACDEGSNFEFLYSLDEPLTRKIETIATEIYGADGVDYDLTARRQLERYEEYGWGRLPICIAKTNMSISHDPQLLGAPRGWTLPIRAARASVGAGFIYPLAGDVRTMPGFGAHPRAFDIDIDASGDIVGLA